MKKYFVSKDIAVEGILQQCSKALWLLLGALETKNPTLVYEFAGHSILSNCIYMVNVEDAICGRIGYAAPENVVTGYLTETADVCSFGLFLFELLAGRRFGISCCNDEALQPD
uniref:Protein kinase domain-containing protein n=1 Tax=Quercus lobata TaxID=97700 RepID=A0A7N2L4E2_QUELO